LKRWPTGAARKPRIGWKKISPVRFNFDQETNFNHEKVRNSLSSKSHCTPDGLFEREGKLYVWEAKNWPLYPEKGPEHQIWNYFSEHPWILATMCECEGKERAISGFLFSFWNIDGSVKNRIETGVNRIIGEDKFTIILSKE